MKWQATWRLSENPLPIPEMHYWAITGMIQLPSLFLVDTLGDIEGRDRLT